MATKPLIAASTLYADALVNEISDISDLVELMR